MRKPRAIIFDDDQMVLELLENVLTKRGYEVLSFSEPMVCPVYEKIGEMCGKENPCADVLITDLKMPKMSGIELLRNQGERGCLLDIKNKAVITAYIDGENKEAVKDLGCAYIMKPFKLSELNEWLDECEKRFDLSRPLGLS